MCVRARAHACLFHHPHQLLNQLIDFYKSQQGGHATEGVLNAIVFNAVAATILKHF
jgi:hypothetical protein